jgi:mannose-1-phosphate guanylyltransferase
MMFYNREMENGRGKKMQALILVGGEATRLRPLTCDMPKAMVPVMNTPFLEHVVRYLGRHGVKDIVLAQGHLPESMDSYFRDGYRFGAKLSYSLETRPMNTAGAVKNAEEFLKGRFFVLNGDIYTDLDITSMLEFHLERKAKVTIALTPVEDPSAYGLVETDARGRITRFLEKPKKEEITTTMINAGTYILEPEVLNSIPAQTNYSFERQLFPALLAEGEPVYAFPSSDYWIDIGTPENYFQLHSDLMSGKSRGFGRQESEIQTGHGCHISPAAELKGAVLIGENCSISQGARLTGPVVIGPGCSILENAVIQESIVWHNVKFGPGASVKNSLVGNHCLFGKDSLVEKSVIGGHITITQNTKLGPGSRVWPETNQGNC